MNLTRVILNGTSGATHTGFNKMQAMPGYKDKISDESLTDMVNYLRQTWGSITDDVTIDEIKAMLKTKYYLQISGLFLNYLFPLQNIIHSLLMILNFFL